MYAIKFLVFNVIFIFSAFNLVMAGYVCPMNMISDHKISFRQSSGANFTYACTCPDGQRPNFNLNAGKVKFGTCRDVGEYKLDITKFDSTKLEMWYDATDPNGDGYLPVVQLNNQSMAYWKDKSGKNLYFSQAIAAKQPTYCRIRNSVTYHGISKPYYCFDNNNNNDKHMISLANAMTIVGQGLSVFIVFIADNAATNSTGTIFASQNLPTYFGLYHNDSVNVNKIAFKFYDNAGNKITSTDNIILYNNGTYNAANQVSIIYNPNGVVDAFGTSGARLDFYLNPFQQKYSTDSAYLSPHMSGRQNLFTFTPSSIVSNLSQFVIGAHSGDTNTGFLGRIGVIIVFSKPLTHGERAEIEAYLRRKWIINDKATAQDIN